MSGSSLRTGLVASRIGGLVVAIVVGVAAGCGDGLSGKYDEIDGAGSLEFKSGKVYVTNMLGMTFAAPYEVDGDRVIIKGAGGSQVFRRSGDSLDGGMGIRFVKK